jgi:hypothetical protein
MGWRRLLPKWIGNLFLPWSKPKNWRMRHLLLQLTAYVCFISVVSLVLLGQEARKLPPLRTASVRNSPALPQVKDSPIEHLRHLLNADREKLASMLEQHSSSTRAFWERKLAEYTALEKQERDRRLRDAQRHWYLMLLLRSEPAERESKLLNIPAPDRALIATRIRDWEALSADLQRDVMTYLPALRYFGRLVSMNSRARKQALEHAQRAGNDLTDMPKGWEQLDPGYRSSMFRAYQQFFVLEKQERSQVLVNIPTPQRQTLQARLEKLEGMAPEVRRKCLEALQTYAEMTPEERTLFQVTAARWKKMHPSEHSIWKKLVRRVPPMPPVRVRSSPPVPSRKIMQHLKTPSQSPQP